MPTERVVLCGGSSGRAERRRALALDIYGPRRNVRLHLHDVRRALWKEIPAVLRDLLDLAAYVTAADQAVGRADGGRVDGDEFGAAWRRAFRFHIPVRVPELWNAPPVRDALVSTLSFLSEDEYTFEFSGLTKDVSLAGFVDFDDTPFRGHVEQVVLFSGGLDSLAGAVTEAVARRRQILLVNHRSTGKLAARHDHLVRALRARAGNRAPVHFPVWANRAKPLGREFTQRTRSFLFAAMAALFAEMIGLDRIRFYENGVVSLNLPVLCGNVVRGKEQGSQGFGSVGRDRLVLKPAREDGPRTGSSWPRQWPSSGTRLGPPSRVRLRGGGLGGGCGRGGRERPGTGRVRPSRTRGSTRRRGGSSGWCKKSTGTRWWPGCCGPWAGWRGIGSAGWVGGRSWTCRRWARPVRSRWWRSTRVR